MQVLRELPRLIYSLATLVAAVALVVLVLRHGVTDLAAVATARNGLGVRDTVYTQSTDGQTLYQWLWDAKAKQWKRETYSGSF